MSKDVDLRKTVKMKLSKLLKDDVDYSYFNDVIFRTNKIIK